MSFRNLLLSLKGGAGSGNWGHAGRPGNRGGSSPKGSWMSAVTSDEVTAVRDWTWLGSQTINARLEDDNVSTSRTFGGPSEQDVVDGLDSIIQKAPKVADNMVLHSKFDAAPLYRQGKLKSGTVISRKGYTSGTTTEGGARSSPSRRYDYEAVMEIHVPKGYKGVANISALSQYPQEGEHIIKRGSKLRIQDVREGTEVYDPVRVVVELVD